MPKLELADKRYGQFDKVTQYGWSIADEPGRFAMIDKKSLHIDPEYQRRVRPKKVDRIAAEWSWVALGALIIADRDGKLYVIDGHHRASAAMKRSDIRSLPCLVFETAGTKDEAEGFLRVNRERAPIGAIQAFKAMLIAGEPDALAAQQLIASAGLDVEEAPGSGKFRAVRALLAMIAQDHAAVKRIWPLVVSVCERDVHVEIMTGIFEIERRLAGEETLARARYRNRLESIGRAELLRHIINAKAFLQSGASRRTVAIGVLTAINHRLRNKLEVPGL